MPLRQENKIMIIILDISSDNEERDLRLESGDQGRWWLMKVLTIST